MNVIIIGTRKFEMNNTISNTSLHSLILLLYMVLTLTSNAQDGNLNTPYDTLIISNEEYGFHNCSRSKVPLFNLPVDSVLELEIKTDFESLFQTEKSGQKRIDGVVSYTYEGKIVKIPIKIKAKGKSRFAFCQYKPLDIEFVSNTESSLFKGLERIYITSHCGEMNGDQWIFRGSP